MPQKLDEVISLSSHLLDELIEQAKRENATGDQQQGVRLHKFLEFYKGYKERSLRTRMEHLKSRIEAEAATLVQEACSEALAREVRARPPPRARGNKDQPQQSHHFACAPPLNIYVYVICTCTRVHISKACADHHKNGCNTNPGARCCNRRSSRDQRRLWATTNCSTLPSLACLSPPHKLYKPVSRTSWGAPWPRYPPPSLPPPATTSQHPLYHDSMRPVRAGGPPLLTPILFPPLAANYGGTRW